VVLSYIFPRFGTLHPKIWFYDDSSKEDISNENISKEEMPKIDISKIY
jgi:hypothetical protein